MGPDYAQYYVTGGVAMRELRSQHRTVACPEQVFSVIDHLLAGVRTAQIGLNKENAPAERSQATENIDPTAMATANDRRNVPAALLVRKGILKQDEVDAEMDKLYDEMEKFDEE